MKRFLSLIGVFLVMCVTPLMAQDNSTGTQEQDTTYAYKMNQAGDQFVKIALMGSFPLNFGDKLETGGMGTLGYEQFLTDWFAAGVSINFGYNPTIGDNIFNYVPIMLELTAQPSLGKFEFPLTLGVGFAVENYTSNTYFPGLVVKPDLGIFYRATPSWSFGIEGSIMYMPQWYYYHPEYNYDGWFAQTAAVARYHF